MSAIDNVVAHFSEKPVRQMEVPEWGLTIYAKNTSVEDRAKIFARAERDHESSVYAIIFAAADKDGELLFDIGDKHKLLNQADPMVVSKVAAFILGLAGADDEEREKNS